jgi:hypothetical protein
VTERTSGREVDEDGHSYLDEARGRTNRITAALLIHQGWKRDPDAMVAIQHGVLLRSGMLIRSLEVLFELPKAGEAPLRGNRRVEANIHLNAFYLNLRGGLDNLARALIAILDLNSMGARELSGQQIDLFGQRFAERLQEADREFARRISKFRKWFVELKELRNPAAHRAPLYVAPSIIGEDEEAEVQGLWRRHGDLAAKGDREGAFEVLMEIEQFGRFLPWLLTPGEEGPPARGLFEQIQEDHEHFLQILELAVGLVLAPEYRGNWVPRAGPLPKRESQPPVRGGRDGSECS